MKKISVVILAMAMSANLAACGGSKTAATTAAPTTEAVTTAAPTTAAPTTEATTAAETEVAEEEALTYELDYDDIASWVDSGFIGTDASGAPVLMALDANSEVALIIFGDNSDMTAVSFLGEITFEGDLATITDVANELALTFGAVQISEDTIELDMGEEIGTATITAVSKDELLETIKMAIDNYEHVM